MHVSKHELQPTIIGEYQGRQVDAGGIRIAFESMPTVANNLGLAVS